MAEQDSLPTLSFSISVDGTAAGIANEPAFHGRRFYARVQLERRIEGFLGGPISNQFDTLKQSAATDIADGRV